MNKKVHNFLLQNLKWLVLIVSIICFILIVINAINENTLTIDTTGYNIVSKYLISDIITPIAKVITFFGGVYWLIGLSILLLFIIKNKKIGVSIALNLALASLTNHTLKHIFQRPRPLQYQIINESGYSLPSGHSMVSMAFYGYLIYLIYKHIKNKYIKWSLISLLGLLILSIGISRIYLGVHYTSDVIAGYLLAISYLIIYISFSNMIIDKINNKNK